MEAIGYIVKGNFQCTICAKKLDCPCYRINIGIYSQSCCICGNTVVKGSACELFTNRLLQDELLEYRGDLAKATTEQDWEAFATIEREMVRRYVVALYKNNIMIGEAKDCCEIVLSVLNQSNLRY